MDNTAHVYSTTDYVSMAHATGTALQVRCIMASDRLERGSSDHLQRYVKCAWCTGTPTAAAGLGRCKNLHWTQTETVQTTFGPCPRERLAGFGIGIVAGSYAPSKSDNVG